MRTRIATAALAALLTGCATSTNMGTSQLCSLVTNPFTTNQAEVFSELVSRGAVREGYIPRIRNRTVVTGMNTCEAMAAWGTPDRTSSYRASGYQSATWHYHSDYGSGISTYSALTFINGQLDSIYRSE